jgi:hypothetical protein
MNKLFVSLGMVIITYFSFGQLVPKFHIGIGYDKLLYRSHYPMGDYLDKQGSTVHYFGLNTSLNKSIFSTSHSSFQLGLQFDYRKLVIEDAQYQYAKYFGTQYTLVPFEDKGDLKRKNFDWNLVVGYMHSFKKESFKNFFID